METPAIEKNVPLPEKPQAYPFAALKVGQSFFVSDRASYEMSGHIARAKKKTGWCFTTKTIKNKQGKILGTRIWREPDESQEKK